MKRIGLLFEYATLNGGEYSILAAIKELHQTECQFVALCPAEGPLVHELQLQSVPTETLQLRTTSGDRISQGELAELVQKAIASHQLDVLHANSLTMGRILGTVSNELSIPTVSHIRDIMSLSRAAVRDLNQHARLVAVSNATREFHIAQGVDPDRIETCYNGIDTESFCPKPATGWLKKELGLPADAVLSASIGQICLRKSQVDSAKAIRLLKDRHPNLHFLLIGERHSAKLESRQFDDEITRIFEEAGISKRLHRLGFRNEIYSILNEIDLLIHPARQEPLGRVLLEAAACAVPIVATNVGGTSEILTHEESALLVDPQNPTLLAEQINRLLSSTEMQKQLTTNSRQEILQRFDIKTSASSLSEIWTNILSGMNDAI